MDHSHIMPKQLVRTHNFIHRSEITIQDGKWVVTGGDPGDLNTLVNDWITKHKPQVLNQASPNVSVYASGPGNDKMIVFATSGLTYLPAIEQHNEQQTYGRQAGELGYAPPGTDPGNTAISAKGLSDGVSASSGSRVRGTSAFPNVGRP